MDTIDTMDILNTIIGIAGLILTIISFFLNKDNQAHNQTNNIVISNKQINNFNYYNQSTSYKKDDDKKKKSDFVYLWAFFLFTISLTCSVIYETIILNTSHQSLISFYANNKSKLMCFTALDVRIITIITIIVLSLFLIYKSYVNLSDNCRIFNIIYYSLLTSFFMAIFIFLSKFNNESFLIYQQSTNFYFKLIMQVLANILLMSNLIYNIKYKVYIGCTSKNIIKYSGILLLIFALNLWLM